MYKVELDTTFVIQDANGPGEAIESAEEQLAYHLANDLLDWSVEEADAP